MPAPSRSRLVVWAERGQETLIREAIGGADLEAVAVGAASSAVAAGLASDLGAVRVGDLRQAIQHPDADVIWLAAADEVGPETRRLIREVGVPTITSEPRPGAVADVLLDADEPATATFVPLFRHGPGFRSALDALQAFGERATVNVCFGGRPGEGTLFARLFDAVDLLRALCGPAEGVDATLAGRRGAVPESLGGLRGHLTANVRFAEGSGACVSASNAAGSWFRRVTIVGEGGCLRIDDRGYAWTAPDDRVETGGDDRPPTPPTAPTPATPGELIGEQITRLLRGGEAAPPPPTAEILAICEAARLSCRTAQIEVPRRVLQMHGRWG